MSRSSVVALGLIVASVVAVSTAPAERAAAATRPTVDLEIEARTGSATSVLVFSSATLDCDADATAAGFLRNVAPAACAAARRGAIGEVAARQREPRVCAEAYGGPQSARLTGRIQGRRVNVVVTRTDGCGSADWDALRPLLGDPERLGRVRARTVTAPTTTTAPPTLYQVQRGDTLTGIARKFHTTVSQITSANQLSDPDEVTEGQTLSIPSTSPLQLDVALAEGADPGFELTLRGGEPGEHVVFVITAPDGSTFTGLPHVTSADGVVTTGYNTRIESGTYKVVAQGDRGSEAENVFHVDPGRA